MTDATISNRSAVHLAIRPLAAAGLLAILGYWPTVKLGGAGSGTAMLMALGVVATAVYASLLPTMRWMRNAAAGQRLRIALAASIFRFSVTAVVAGLMAWTGLVEPIVFLLWVAISYVPLIGAETWTLIAWTRQLEIRS